MDFDLAGLRQGARQSEHLRANRCLIYGQTVLHFESGLLFSWPPIWQPVESVEPVRAPSLSPSVPCPRRDRPGLRQGRVCTTTASVLQRPQDRAQPKSQNGRSLTRPIPPSHHLSPHRPPLAHKPCCRAPPVPKYRRTKTIPRDRSSLSPAPTLQGTPVHSHQPPLPYSASWASESHVTL